tara:strand:- start:296 stop:472 length:177 start_codon:yes stop_codon:yes gene_type:complete
VKETNKRWYHIKAHDTDIGKVITFWLSGTSESDIKKILSKKNIKDIKWIKQEEPEFDK